MHTSPLYTLPLCTLYNDQQVGFPPLKNAHSSVFLGSHLVDGSLETQESARNRSHNRFTVLHGLARHIGSGAFQFAIRIDLIRFVMRIDSNRFVL